MNPKHAQYMITVFQEGSITNAAKKLYVSQPSLSQMIKLVETNLGTPIFNRSTDPLTLTYAGEKYIEAAQKILTINANLAREIEEINDEEHGKIRLGIPVQLSLIHILLNAPSSSTVSTLLRIFAAHSIWPRCSSIMQADQSRACLLYTSRCV